MTDRSVTPSGSIGRAQRREVRNPALSLPGVRALCKLEPNTRAAIVTALRDIQGDARARAEKCWRTHKAPMAVYWKAVAVYAGHLARALAAPPPAPSTAAGIDIDQIAQETRK